MCPYLRQFCQCLGQHTLAVGGWRDAKIQEVTNIVSQQLTERPQEAGNLRKYWHTACLRLQGKWRCGVRPVGPEVRSAAVLWHDSGCVYTSASTPIRQSKHEFIRGWSQVSVVLWRKDDANDSSPGAAGLCGEGLWAIPMCEVHSSPGQNRPNTGHYSPPFSSAQDSIFALGKAHMRSTSSVTCFRSVAWHFSKAGLTDDGLLSSIQWWSSNSPD